MACKTCGHTMQRVNNGEPIVFWCPRCGTIKTEKAVPEFDRPKIIQRASSVCSGVFALIQEHRLADTSTIDARVRDLKECWK